MKCSFGFSNFLEEISSLSHSIVSLYLFALITEEGFLISPRYSSELCSQTGISFLFSAICSEVKVIQLFLILCNPMGYTVHWFLQARILGWVAFPFSRGFYQTRDQTQFSHIAGGFFTSWATREVLFVRPPQKTILSFCNSFSWRWSWSLPPVQCHKSLSIVLQGLCLSDLFPWTYLSLPFYNCKGFDLGHTWMI